ncbi:tyrosine-type recombinase/integrase [Pseudomonadota bacterium]
MPLTDTAIRNAKPREKRYKLYDVQGLYLLIIPNGGKWWRHKYRVGGKEKLLSLGTYPEVSLKLAREKRDDHRRLLANDKDPGEHRKIRKREGLASTTNSFEVIAREWHTKMSRKWSDGYADDVLHRLDKNLFPWLGNQPIQKIAAPELLETLRRIERRGAIDTAHKMLQYCGQIFLYAIATGLAVRNPAADLKGALPPVKKTRMASILEPKRIGELLNAIDGYSGEFVTRCALQLAPLVFVRPGELRKAEWREFDLDKAEWRIPPQKMKARRPHTVPLSRQAVAILNELQPLTGNGKYVFPGIRTKSRPMSENTVNAALRRMDFAKEEMTGHGFRSIASTLLNEQGWSSDAIERQLAHVESNEVRAAYNHAQHLPERRKMMQAWSDYLMDLKNGH